MSPVMPKVLEEMGGQIKSIRTELAGFFAKKDADGRIDVDAKGRDKMRELNDSLKDLVPKFTKSREDWIAEEENKQALKALVEPQVPLGFFGARGHDGAAIDKAGTVKGFGDLFADSAGYKNFLDAKGANSGIKTELRAELPANMKTLFQRTAGWDPFVTRMPGYVGSAQQQPKIVDMIPSGNTDQAAIKWMLETLYQNNAAPVPEAGQYPESAYKVTEQLTAIQKIAHFIPTTDEQIADVAGIRDYLDNRLTLGLKQALDRQVLSGDGTGSNLTGFFSIAGTQVQAQASDNVQDAIYKLIVKIQSVAFADPSGIWMHPLDFQAIRLFKTTQGLYLFGNPDQTGEQRMWGLPVATSTYVTQGKSLVGDFQMYSHLFYRAGVNVEVSNSHADYFIKGQLAIRAQLRAGLICTRPAAVGITTLNPNGTPNP